MTNYSSQRVTELKDLLSKRKLPTNGKKEELIARLEASDRETAASTTALTTTSTTTPPAATTPTPAADPTAHLPSAEEYEINWDEDDTTATGLKSAKPATTTTTKKNEAPTVAEVKKVVVEQPKPVDKKAVEPQAPAESKDGNGGSTGKKPFTFKRLAEQFSDLPSTKKPDTKKSANNSKSDMTNETPTPVAATENKETNADQPASEKLTEAKPEQAFVANLPPTPLEVELAKRKARAARFGAEVADPTATESVKKLERAARFGGAGANTATTGAEENVGVKGLDQALPERGDRRGKRHGESIGGQRGGVQKRPRRHGGNGGGQRSNGRESNGQHTQNQNRDQGQQRKPAGAQAKSVLDDPVEREKAEQRRSRFGNAAA